MTNDIVVVGILLTIISIMCMICVITIRLIEQNEDNDISILDSTPNDLYTTHETEDSGIIRSNTTIEL